MRRFPSVTWSERFFQLTRGEGCPMCAEDGPEDTGLGLRFLEGLVSNAYLQRVAVQPGYTVVVWTRPHIVEPMDLPPDQATSYWRDVMDAASLLRRHFQPIKMNFLTLGNELPHLHTHIIPRYDRDPSPGRPFPFPERRMSPRSRRMIFARRSKRSAR